MSRVIRFFFGAAAVMALSAGAFVTDQTSPETVPHKVPEAPQEQHSGSSLSGRLDQTDGVIRPPSGVDPGVIQSPPPAGHSTPVIPPPGTAGGDENVHPK